MPVPPAPVLPRQLKAHPGARKTRCQKGFQEVGVSTGSLRGGGSIDRYRAFARPAQGVRTVSSPCRRVLMKHPGSGAVISDTYGAKRRKYNSLRSSTGGDIVSVRAATKQAPRSSNLAQQSACSSHQEGRCTIRDRSSHASQCSHVSFSASRLSQEGNHDGRYTITIGEPVLQPRTM